ncbi:TetR family transcriptional regulator [Mycobacteroides abscessus subsp. abscessus]|nr:TetR family transcriptional regulator [Mycobacteroides abscessus subsp. abscessus]
MARAYTDFAAATDVETLTETVWSTLHGLASLERDARLRPGLREQRLDILERWLTGA